MEHDAAPGGPTAHAVSVAGARPGDIVATPIGNAWLVAWMPHGRVSVTTDGFDRLLFAASLRTTALTAAPPARTAAPASGT